MVHLDITCPSSLPCPPLLHPSFLYFFLESDEMGRGVFTYEAPCTTFGVISRTFLGCIGRVVVAQLRAEREYCTEDGAHIPRTCGATQQHS